MKSHVGALARAQRHGQAGWGAKDALRWLSFVCLIVSGFFWFPLRWQVVTPHTLPEALMAISSGLFMVIGVPVLTSFLIPWTPAGMFLQKINGKTWGHVIVIACSLFLLYYAYQSTVTWWAVRPPGAGVLVADPHTEAILGIIATILVPALLWAPVSTDELVELARQEHLIKRYELATAADIAIIQVRLLEAQRIAAKRIEDTTADERSWLHGAMQSLTASIDHTLAEVAGNVRGISGTYADYTPLTEQPDVVEILDYIADSLHVPESDTDRQPGLLPVDAAAALYATEYAHARGLDLPQVWTKKNLAAAFQRDERTAQRWIAAWREAGWITEVNLGRYSFTEGA